MDFLESVSNKISETGNSIADKARQYVKGNDLNAEINKCKQQIDALCMEFGSYVYRQSFDIEDEEFQSYTDKLSEQYRALNDLQDKLERLQSQNICPDCGRELQEGDRFCPSCGINIEEARQQLLSTGNVCPNCGKRLQEDMLFCNQCGTRIRQEE